MTKRPSFTGFQHPDGTRANRVSIFREFLQESPKDEFSQEFWLEYVQDSESPLGAAWDRIVDTLMEAVTDPTISNNQVAVEFLHIVCSLAQGADPRTNINDVLSPLKYTFQKQMAYDNKVVSQGKFDEAKFWMLGDLEKNGGAKGSKNKIAKDYAIKIKNKFGLTVSADTIARHWL